MRKRLVIIGANDFQNQLILKAKEMGYETHVFAWESGDIGEKTADYFYPISITEKEQILEKCKEIRPAGVCSIASDLATITVNYVSEKLGLNSNAYSSTLQCTNKYEMRKVMLANGINTPRFLRVSKDSSTWNVDDMTFPIIVKPTDRSGSRGITKIFKKEELGDAINNSINNSFEKRAIVEEFIEGEEYSCECISYKGKHHFLTFTKKYTTGAPNYIETEHKQPSDIKLEYQEKIKEEIFKTLDALEVKNGASHTEFKIDENGICRIIEVGARMGGDCIGSDLVKLSTGYDFTKMVIEVACGREPTFKQVCKPKIAKIKFIVTQQDLDGLEKYKDKSMKNIYRISELVKENIGKTVDSSTRVGYYITVE